MFLVITAYIPIDKVLNIQIYGFAWSENSHHFHLSAAVVGTLIMMMDKVNHSLSIKLPPLQMMMMMMF